MPNWLDKMRAPKPFKLDEEKRSQVEETIHNIGAEIENVAAEAETLASNNPVAFQRSWHSMMARIDQSYDNFVGPSMALGDITDFRRMQSEPDLKKLFDAIQNSQTVAPDLLEQSLKMRVQDITAWIERHDIQKWMAHRVEIPRVLAQHLDHDSAAFKKVQPFLNTPMKRWQLHLPGSPSMPFMKQVLEETEHAMTQETTGELMSGTYFLQAISFINHLREAGALEECKALYPKEYGRLVELYSSDAGRREITAYVERAIGDMYKKFETPEEEGWRVRAAVSTAVDIAAVREMLKLALKS